MFNSTLKIALRRMYDFYPHITFTKFYNLVLNLFEKSFRVINLRSSPVALKIDPGPFCQLNCPLCYHNDSEFNKKFKLNENLSKEGLVKIVEPLKKQLVWISLSHRGEPFMNPNLLELIEYIHENNIAVSFPTNFSVKLNDSKIEKLVKSGLDRIIVSLDGASQETNEKYRVGSNFELITSNVRFLADLKKKFGLSRPKIVWKFIIFDHNKHEINYVKENYKLLGFDSYEFVYNSSGNTAIEKREKEHSKRIKKNCYWLWQIMVIQSDGQVNPCCNGKNFNIGNAFESNILQLWNNQTYHNLRNGFKKGNFPNKLHNFCKECYKV